MDKTLADYIKRVQQQTEPVKEDKPVENNYEVLPEEDGYDRPRNPYSNH